MEILNTTITARASANYQVGEVSIQIANYTEEELGSIQRYTVDKAVHICNELQAKVNPNTTPVQPKTEVKTFNTQQQAPRKPSYRTDGNYQPTQNTQAPVQNTQPQTLVHNGFQYKLCTNNQTGEKFYALVNPDDMNRGAQKYYKPGV